MKAENFGSFLRNLRKKRKLTIRQLEILSGVSNSYLSQIETGERGVPSPEILKKLSKPLGISYEGLMRTAGYLPDEDEEDPRHSPEIQAAHRRIEEALADALMPKNSWNSGRR